MRRAPPQMAAIQRQCRARPAGNATSGGRPTPTATSGARRHGRRRASRRRTSTLINAMVAKGHSDLTRTSSGRRRTTRTRTSARPRDALVRPAAHRPELERRRTGFARLDETPAERLRRPHRGSTSSCTRSVASSRAPDALTNRPPHRRESDRMQSYDDDGAGGCRCAGVRRAKPAALRLRQRRLLLRERPCGAGGWLAGPLEHRRQPLARGDAPRRWPCPATTVSRRRPGDRLLGLGGGHERGGDRRARRAHARRQAGRAFGGSRGRRRSRGRSPSTRAAATPTRCSACIGSAGLGDLARGGGRVRRRRPARPAEPGDHRRRWPDLPIDVDGQNGDQGEVDLRWGAPTTATLTSGSACVYVRTAVDWVKRRRPAGRTGRWHLRPGRW